MADLSRLLAVLARLDPSIWDAIIPHGPRWSERIASPASKVELNPQPLPPRQELVFAAAAVAHEIASSAIAAQASGVDPMKLIGTALEGWCGNEPRPIPWPYPWPFPDPIPWPGPGPDPGPLLAADIAAARVVGALSFASVASRLTEGPTRDALSKGAEQLLEVALED